MARKKIAQTGITGQQGVNLVEQIVLRMGFVWYPTGGLEAGTDGFIEIRDPATGDMTNCTLKAQSRATTGSFNGETAEKFDYYCDEKDLDYWLAGNTPFILIISRPATAEAYWVSTKDYFKDSEVRKKRKITLNKTSNRFDDSCRQSLIDLAVPKDSGLYLAPLPKKERLLSNLLEVRSFATDVFSAKTRFRSYKGVWASFKKKKLNATGEWILTDKEIHSFHDLREPPWKTICTVSSVVPTKADTWAFSPSADKRRHFVQLLNRCLSEKLRAFGIRFKKEYRCHYFWASSDLSPRAFQYKSLVEETTREVFSPHYSTKDPEKLTYCRHSAMEGRFLLLGAKWYLEITPTYVFTSDGHHVSRFSGEYLSGIKRLENNAAVRGQVLMWADILSRAPDLLTPRYPFLEFDQLQEFEIESGFTDDDWLSRDSAATDDDPLPLFE